MTSPHANERGMTLTEVAVVMILGTMIMAGMVGFYLSSQGLWLDASTQAITQRDELGATFMFHVRQSIFCLIKFTYQRIIAIWKSDHCN